MQLSKEETNLIVSILNLNHESLGYTMEDEGSFGYNPETLEISCNDCTLKEGLQLLWDELCSSINMQK